MSGNNNQVAKEVKALEEFKAMTSRRYEELRDNRLSSMLRMIIKISGNAVDTEAQEGNLKKSTEIIAYYEPIDFGAPTEIVGYAGKSNQRYGLLLVSFSHKIISTQLNDAGAAKKKLSFTLFEMRPGSDSYKDLLSIETQMDYNDVSLVTMYNYPMYNIAMFYYAQCKKMHMVYSSNGKIGQTVTEINYNDDKINS